MLNNTALPSPRILIAILENYQEEDGSSCYSRSPPSIYREGPDCFEEIRQYTKKEAPRRSEVSFKNVGAGGIEPTTVGLKGHCSTD
jgi:hypothetical protein